MEGISGKVTPSLQQIPNINGIYKKFKELRDYSMEIDSSFNIEELSEIFRSMPKGP
jgi:hypothetical protein